MAIVQTWSSLRQATKIDEIEESMTTTSISNGSHANAKTNAETYRNSNNIYNRVNEAVPSLSQPEDVEAWWVLREEEGQGDFVLPRFRGPVRPVQRTDPR